MVTLNERKEHVIKIATELGAMEPADVVLDLDFSGSMKLLYEDGRVQRLLNRILPMGLAFDANKAITFWLFHNGFIRMEDITEKNVDTIATKAIKTHSMGATNYSPVLTENLKAFENRGLFGNKALDKPVLIIMPTDGTNYDIKDTNDIIRKMSATGMFIATIGIGDQNFDYLQSIDTMTGRKLDNVSFTRAVDIERMPDEELYRNVLGEYAKWIPQARAKGYIKPL